MTLSLRPLAALGLTLAASAAAAGPLAFDPRGGRGRVAGPPTQVLILGTDHLAQLAHPVDPSALEPLLGRLAVYAPTVIAVEALSGQGCELLARHPAVYPGVAD